MSWLGLGLGELGSQLGQAKQIADQWRMQQEQLRLEQSRQKMEESLLPLRMAEIQEIQQRVARANQPQFTWHQLPGGGLGYTRQVPGQAPGPLQTVLPGGAEYEGFRVGKDGSLFAYNKTKGREEQIPGAGPGTFPVPGAKSDRVSTYDPNGNLRYARWNENGQVTAWGPEVPESQAFRTEMDEQGNVHQWPIPRHIRQVGPIDQTTEALSQWNEMMGKKPPGAPAAKTPTKPAATAPPSAAAKPETGGPPGLSAAITRTFDTSKLVPKAGQPGQAPPTTPGAAAPAERPTHPGEVITKRKDIEADAKKIVRTIDEAQPLVNEILPIMQQQHWETQNSLSDALKERGRWFVYQRGIQPAPPWDKVMQLSSLLRVMMTTPYLRGLRNMQYISQIQQHLPNPEVDTPAFMYSKLRTILPLLAQIREDASHPVPMTPRP